MSHFNKAAKSVPVGLVLRSREIQKDRLIALLMKHLSSSVRPAIIALMSYWPCAARPKLSHHYPHIMYNIFHFDQVKLMWNIIYRTAVIIQSMLKHRPPPPSQKLDLILAWWVLSDNHKVFSTFFLRSLAPKSLPSLSPYIHSSPNFLSFMPVENQTYYTSLWPPDLLNPIHGCSELCVDALRLLKLKSSETSKCFFIYILFSEDHLHYIER